jgi:hypothetical protein
MIDMPADTPVSRPAEFTVATAGFDEDQLTPGVTSI